MQPMKPPKTPSIIFSCRGRRRRKRRKRGEKKKREVEGNNGIVANQEIFHQGKAAPGESGAHSIWLRIVKCFLVLRC